MGFEPMTPVSQGNRLAGGRTRPLCDPSGQILAWAELGHQGDGLRCAPPGCIMTPHCWRSEVEPNEDVEVLIEIPRGSRNKYEYDEETGVVRLDRVLYSSVHYPTDYGLIPHTRAPDGDHLDVLVVVEEPTFPGCRLRARPIGVLQMRDEKGLDHKIIAVPLGGPPLEGLRGLKEPQPPRLRPA